MSIITLTFTNNINSSVQIGDTAYYCDTETLGSNQVASKDDIIEIGTISTVSDNQIVCREEVGITPPTTDSFILFSKDNIANLSGVRGYFSEIEIRNNSTDEAEMFGIGCDIFESSK
jgi:hypothetical protein